MVHKFVPRTTAALAMLVLQQGAHAQQPATTENTQATGMERVQITGSRINLRQEQLSGVGPVTVIDAHGEPRVALLRLFAGVGFLGGYTTFSTAMVDTLHLALPVALLYLLGTLVPALLAVAVGWFATERVLR